MNHVPFDSSQTYSNAGTATSLTRGNTIDVDTKLTITNSYGGQPYVEAETFTATTEFPGFAYLGMPTLPTFGHAWLGWKYDSGYVPATEQPTGGTGGGGNATSGSDPFVDENGVPIMLASMYFEDHADILACKENEKYGSFPPGIDNSEPGPGLDWLQGTLDVAGIFDPTLIFDGANAIISIAQRNWKDAAYSAVAMVPYIGDVIGKGGK